MRLEVPLWLRHNVQLLINECLLINEMDGRKAQAECAMKTGSLSKGFEMNPHLINDYVCPDHYPHICYRTSREIEIGKKYPVDLKAAMRMPSSRASK